MHGYYLHVHVLQDSISDLKKKMATNAKENEEKTRAIKEVRVEGRNSRNGVRVLHLAVVI